MINFIILINILTICIWWKATNLNLESSSIICRKGNVSFEYVIGSEPRKKKRLLYMLGSVTVGFQVTCKYTLYTSIFF